MKKIASFSSNRKFYGDSQFPYGIDRSGEFTRQQANLLMSHGWAYLELAEGNRVSVTPEEKAFVAVCRGEREPKTDHERVWRQYCLIISGLKLNISSPLVNYNSLAGSGLEMSLDDDHESSMY